MKTQIGIKDSNMEAVAQELGKILADENILYLKTKNAHWNVQGHDFHEKHIFFEGQFQQLDSIIDRVAERIRSIGHFAPASMKAFLELTRFTETLHKQNDAPGFISELLCDHESIIITLREKIHPFGNDFKDLGSADFITGIMEEHEKMAWFLRSHL